MAKRTPPTPATPDSTPDDQGWLEDYQRITPLHISDDDALAGADLLPTGKAAPPPLPTRQRIQQSAYDALMFRQAREEMPDLDQTVRADSVTWPTMGTLSADVHAALYKAAPQTQDVTDEDYAENARAIDEMLDTSDYQSLRQQTILDEFGAALATNVLAHRIAETLVEQRQAREEQEQQQRGDGDQQGAGQGAGATGGGAGGNQPRDPRTPQQDEQERTALRVAARQAAQQASQQVQAYQEMMATFGGGDSEIGAGWGTGAGQRQRRGDMALRARLAYLASHDQRLQHIARLAGRLRRLAAAAQRMRAHHTPDELVGVEVGADLTRILPQEMALLGSGNAALETLWFAKFLERGLLQYEMSGKQPVGKGPVIVCVDESGSMGGAASEWAAGVALALLGICAKQRRMFRWVHFGSSYELDHEDYPDGRGAPTQVMESALHFFGGGTDFDHPLTTALEAIETSALAKADVIFVTDGQCQVSDAVLERWVTTKAAKQFSCFALLIGRDDPYARATLDTFADSVVVVNPYRQGDDRDALAEAFAS